jgi:hypothetical protein
MTQHTLHSVRTWLKAHGTWDGDLKCEPWLEDKGTSMFIEREIVEALKGCL